jgi:hypothetical protein
MHGPRNRLLGPMFLVLAVGTLALTACNSNSVSGNQPKTSTTSAAETKPSTTSNAPQAKGLIDAAIAKSK